jgi:uncharacterized protein YdeI (YjbR/CyaY-like superfamily)
MAETRANLAVITFESAQAWEAWLEEHHPDTNGIWMKIAKKEGGATSVSYAQALECALCYGWIDGQKAAFDDRYWLQKFTPRSRKSKWSKINCDKALALIAAGRMQPAGLAQVAAAQGDGRWEQAYESQSKISVPPDLQLALDNHPAARDFFEQLDSVNRYAILYRIHTAVKPETRAKRIQKYVTMLSNQEKIYP